jgi:galactose mutarotase-like enzyme
VWASRAPILFPIVGELAEGHYLHEGKRYALPRHGFARRERFETLTVTPRSVLMRLETNETLYEVYPWRFSLDVSFAIDGATLTVIANVRNTDYHDMPVSVGFHPGFRWPLAPSAPRESAFLEFEHDEPAPIRRLSRKGLLTAHLHATPVRGRHLALTDALFEDDVVIFERLRSRSVNYGAADGPKLQVGFPDAPFLGLWSRPGAGFVCIEPWQGVADPEGAAGDLWVKPGIVRLPPGAVHALHMTVTLRSG